MNLTVSHSQSLGFQLWVGEVVVFRDFTAFEREILGGFVVLMKLG